MRKIAKGFWDEFSENKGFGEDYVEYYCEVK